jgi:AcrR family transcriptional regulator
LDVFGTRGFHATSMEDIAERAGVTKPVLYQHFPSKGELYLELVETTGAQMLEAVAAGATSETLPYRRVLEGFRAYFRFVEDRTTAFRLLFGGGAREESAVADAVTRIETSMAAVIAELIDVELDQDHRALLGFAIVGLAEVTSRQWVLRSEEPDPDRSDDHLEHPLDRAEGNLLAQRLADLVWAGLRGLPEGSTIVLDP